MSRGSIMTETQIKEEYTKLMVSQLEAVTACNYYLDQHIRILLELQKMHEEWKSMNEIENLSEEEQEKNDIATRSLIVRIESGEELLKLIGRLKDKAQRKCNEINQKVDLFCKRHGIGETQSPNS